MPEPWTNLYSGSVGYPLDTSNPPVWLRLVESGTGGNTVFTGYYSLNGGNWTKVGATPSSGSNQISFTHSTNGAGVYSTCMAVFSNLSTSPLLFTTPPEAGGSTAPAMLTGTTCQLSTAGQGPAGTTIASCTWSASRLPLGVTPPTYSINGSSAAQTTTATFYAAGTYVLTATLTDSAGDVATDTVTVVVQQTPTSVAVTQSSAGVPASTSQTASAMCYDQFGNPIETDGFYGAVNQPTGYGPYDNWVSPYGVPLSLLGDNWTAAVGTAGANASDPNESNIATYTAPSTAGPDTLTATALNQSGAIAGVSGTIAITVVASGLPAAPAGLTATAISATAIDLSWPSVTGAMGYDIYRGTTAGGESATILAATAAGVTSYQDTSAAGQTTYYYLVKAVGSGGVGPMSPEASATTLQPTLGLSDADIGTPQQAGSASYAAGTGVYTVSGGGADIWGAADSFNFDYAPLVGNGYVLAEVTSVQDTSGLAKAGVMFRNSTADDNMMAFLAVTPADGVIFETRTSQGGTTTAQFAPDWPDRSGWR